MRNRLLFLVCCFAGIVFASCTPQRVREAQVVVSQADSLKAVGAEYDDSLRLAEAAWVLASFPYSIVDADDYTRVCYHYGRLLCRHDNQVEAMRWFIKGTKAHSNDHTTKGRIYTNIGEMCHLADEFKLSFDMYKKCADEMLNANDSIRYFYSLYSMAFESAEMKQTEKTLSLIDEIRQNCADYDVLTYTWIPLGVLYSKLKDYQSVLYAANQLQQRGNRDAIGYMYKANAFWSLEQYDSAVYYANELMKLPYASEFEKYKMLYILAYSDMSIPIDSLKILTENRADIEKEILEPRKIELKSAVNELLVNINTETQPSYYIFILIIIVIGSIILYLLTRLHLKKIEIFTRECNELEQRVEQGKIEQDILLKMKNEISASNSELLQQSCQLKKQIEDDMEKMRIDFENRCKSLRESADIDARISLSDYSKMSALTNNYFNMFAQKLEELDTLSEQEIKFCVLVLCGVSLEHISELLFYSYKSVGKVKERIAKKLGTNSKNMRSTLMDLALKSVSQ